MAKAKPSGQFDTSNSEGVRQCCNSVMFKTLDDITSTPASDDKEGLERSRERRLLGLSAWRQKVAEMCSFARTKKAFHTPKQHTSFVVMNSQCSFLTSNSLPATHSSLNLPTNRNTLFLNSFRQTLLGDWMPKSKVASWPWKKTAASKCS